jgi:hypothetical protein
MGIKSGSFWITWANANAQPSTDVNDLAEPFKTNVKDFIRAMTDAGVAYPEITTARRSAKRAYLFHWCWLSGLGKVKAADAKPMLGVDIEWDHGKDADSIAGAKEMIAGFGLAVPPKSTNAPALDSKHINGTAIDMTFTWKGSVTVRRKNDRIPYVAFAEELAGPIVRGLELASRVAGLGEIGNSPFFRATATGPVLGVEIPFVANPNANTKLHKVAASYGVYKLKTDAPHWSDNGH